MDTTEAVPPEPPPTASDLSRRIVARLSRPGDDPGSAAAALGACDCVATEFSRWLGGRGYDALMSRALAEARVVHPALATIGYEYRAGPGLSGVAESITRHGADATARALEALLEAILALCIRLIGDDIVATLVEKSVEECASRRAAQTEPHHRSATS